MPSHLAYDIIRYLRSEIAKTQQDQARGDFERWPAFLEDRVIGNETLTTIDRLIDSHLHVERDIYRARGVVGLHAKSDAMLERIDSMNKRLVDIEGLQKTHIEKPISGNNVRCVFADSDDQRFPNFITNSPLAPDQPVLPLQQTFEERIKQKHFKDAETIVIVDPYALAIENDSGGVSSSINTIHRLCSASPADTLFLYCRRDVTEVAQWERLLKMLSGFKITVLMGDLHDRYFFTGNNTKKSVEILARGDWKGKSGWAGAAFGGSLNGVSKRPTYILKFGKEDINSLIDYLDGECKSETLAAFKAKKEQNAAEKALKKSESK